jgi:two-component system CAI-1 autoinducer sensor kinase/phosphatase CqsS
VRIIIDGQHQPPCLLFIDTGCGIAPHHLPLIFRRFYSYPAHNGSGIGLALCQDICVPGMAASAASRARAPTPFSYSNFPLSAPAR